MNYKDITLILPTLNEERNIQKLIKTVNSLYPGIRIIVADDGSTDKTQQIAGEFQNVAVLDRSSKRVKGLTASVIDAFRLAKTRNIIVMDADFQHPPEKIREIADSLKCNDLVIGARERVANEWPLRRKLVSWGGDALARTRLALKPFICLDTMSGFFGIKASLFRNILSKKGKRFEKKGYKVLFEILKYLPKKTNIGHVNYVFGERKQGQTKIRPKHIFYHLKSLFK